MVAWRTPRFQFTSQQRTWRGWRFFSLRDPRSTQSSRARRYRASSHPLMDGAIATNTPIRAAADLGASRLIVLPTGYACSLKEPPKGAIARALHAITLLIEWQLIRDLERLGDEIYVCIVPTLCPLDVSPYDFSASHYLIERAAENTRKWLDRGGLSRRSSPQELQAHRH